MERVTVLIAVHNAEATIYDTIQSVFDQTFKDFKIAIINDSSVDKTLEIIEGFQSDKIEVTHLKTKNVIAGLNRAIDECQSDYIARIDHDDLMLPDRLEEQVKFMDSNPHIVASGSYVETFGNYKKVWTRFRPNEEQLRRNFFWFNSMSHTSSIFRISTLKEFNIRYNREFAFIDGENDYPLTEDFKFCYDLSRVGGISNIPKVLTKYRIHDAQTSISKKNAQDLAANRTRREGLIDFLNDQGMNIDKIDGNTDKIALLEKLNTLKVAKKDRWHLAMSKYMLVQSTKELGFIHFFKILFFSPFAFDRNSPELFMKMIYSKFGNEKPMI